MFMFPFMDVKRIESLFTIIAKWIQAYFSYDSRPIVDFSGEFSEQLILQLFGSPSMQLLFQTSKQMHG